MVFTGVQPAVDVVEPPYGLASVAEVINHGTNDGHWGLGFEQEYGLCGIHGMTWEFCQNSATTDLSGPHDDFERWGKVWPFMVVAQDECRNVLSARRPEMERRLLKILDALTMKGVERELWYGPTVGAGDNEGRFFTDGTAEMVGTDVSPKLALANIEDALAQCLPGVRGTIHMPPGMAAYLGADLSDVNGQLVTKAGSFVAVGAGYAGDEPSIYGTGPVIAHLGKSEMVTDDFAEMTDAKLNEIILRAERPAAVAFDSCCLVGATVTYS